MPEGPILVDAALWADLVEAGVPEDRLVIQPSVDDPPPAPSTRWTPGRAPAPS